jgi:hypothetical protein
LLQMVPKCSVLQLVKTATVTVWKDIVPVTATVHILPSKRYCTRNQYSNKNKRCKYLVSYIQAQEVAWCCSSLGQQHEKSATSYQLMSAPANCCWETNLK